MTLADLIDDIEFLDDWEDRYRYLIEIGKNLAPLADDERNPSNKVEGCASQVWLVSKIVESEDGKKSIHFRGDSDALIVKGLIAVALTIFSGKTADEITDIDPLPIFEQLGLNEHLTKQRSNGLVSMVGRIKAHAKSIDAE